MIVHEFCEEDPLEANHRYRSNFVRKLVQRPNEPSRVPVGHVAPPRKRIVQFWDDLGRLPEDVRECMESWKKLEQFGFELQVFDESSAREFIRVHLGSRYDISRAFETIPPLRYAVGTDTCSVNSKRSSKLQMYPG